MLEKFKDYLDLLPLTTVIRNRIEEVILLNLKIQEFEILDIFVCELKNQEGSRNYTSLWLFTKEIAIECKNFLTTNDFDITPYNKKIGYCSISPIEFDFETTSEKSIVNIHFTFSTLGIGVAGDLIATEDNCKCAFEIYKKYIVANLDK